MNIVWRYAYSCCFSLPHSEPFFLAASSILAGNTKNSLLKYAENACDHPFLNGSDWTQSSLGSLGVQPETMCFEMLPSFRQMKADLTYYPFPLSTRTVKRASCNKKIPLNAALTFCFLCGDRYGGAFYGCFLFFGFCQIPYYIVAVNDSSGNDSSGNQKWTYCIKLMGYCGLIGAVSLSVWIWSKWMNWGSGNVNFDGSTARSQKLSLVLWSVNILFIMWTFVVFIEIFTATGDLSDFVNRRRWIYVSYLLMTSFTLVTLVLVYYLIKSISSLATSPFKLLISFSSLTHFIANMLQYASTSQKCEQVGGGWVVCH
jgi:hypothetical protein